MKRPWSAVEDSIPITPDCHKAPGTVYLFTKDYETWTAVCSQCGQLVAEFRGEQAQGEVA